MKSYTKYEKLYTIKIEALCEIVSHFVHIKVNSSRALNTATYTQREKVRIIDVNKTAVTKQRCATAKFATAKLSTEQI